MHPLRNHSKVSSDLHPISIIYRLRRRVRYLFERIFPRLYLFYLMELGFQKQDNKKDKVEKRFEQFAERIPLNEVDYKNLLTDIDRKSNAETVYEIQQHRFDLLGSGLVYLGEKIRWHNDFVTGYEWDPTCIYSAIPKVVSTGTDIKRPWELNRCQHFIGLGLGFRIYEREEYIDEFVNEIEDWIIRNPIGYGVNWSCAMDVAIRAVNWVAAFCLFQPALSNKKYTKFQAKLNENLWKHARFLETHLEWNGPFSERRANHFLANLTGLFTLGILFSDTFKGMSWLKFSKKWLEKEMCRQVFQDGVHFECSTSYHRLCYEMFLWCYCLGIRHRLTFSMKYKSRLDKMAYFIGAYSHPNGIAPLFGDNDDGRLLYSGTTKVIDHSYLFTNKENNEYSVDAALLKGSQKKRLYLKEGLNAFKDAGFYIIRNPHFHLIIRAGRIAHLGVHAHCDQSSFELSIDRTPVFIDRGTYVYTSDIKRRNLYRSSRAHNVISVNGLEQNRTSGKIFGLIDDTTTKVLHASDKSVIVRLAGFKSLNRNELTHTRSFSVSEDSRALEIEDIVEGLKNNDTVEWFFHLSSQLNVSKMRKFLSIKHYSETICKMIIPSSTEVSIVRFDHSPSYGRLQMAQSLIFHSNTDGKKHLKRSFRIIW